MGRDLQDTHTARMQNILRIAHGLQEATAVFDPSPFRTNDVPATIDSIDLTTPSPLLPSLLEAGASLEVASVVSQIYLRCAERLKRRIQESVAITCRKATEFPVSTSVLPPDLLMKKVASIFAEIYLRRLEVWKEESIQRVKQALKQPAKSAPKTRHAFNHDYIPLLERFFEANPLPTHADKAFLARKSNMQYRQIHVWFQNRRSRTKREGKVAGKNSKYEGTEGPLDKLYERMKSHIVDSDSQSPRTSKACSSEGAAKPEIAGNKLSRDTFASSPPPHAFPSSYPPIYHYDPFPCKNGPAYLSRPLWRRTSCGQAPLAPSIGVDELVERFSQLNVRDETHSKGSTKLQSYAATAAITVLPSRAPHPSLIVGEHHQSAHTVQHHPIVRASRPGSKVFRSPGPASEPVTLVPLSSFDQNELFGRRKTAPLPRRFRDRVQNARRDSTPSESSSTSASPRLLSPDTESCDSSSSISPPSAPLDTAGTHEFLRLFGSPCQSPLDNLLYLHDLGDMSAIVSSSVS